MRKILMEAFRVIIQLSRMGSFMASSCLVASKWLKTWGELAWNSGNLYHFHTKTLFGKIDFSAVVKSFRSQYLVFPFWIKCIRRWYGQFYWGLSHIGPGGGGKVLDHPVYQPILIAEKAKKCLKEHFHFNTDLYSPAAILNHYTAWY